MEVDAVALEGATAQTAPDVLSGSPRSALRASPRRMRPARVEPRPTARPAHATLRAAAGHCARQAGGEPVSPLTPQLRSDAVLRACGALFEVVIGFDIGTM